MSNTHSANRSVTGILRRSLLALAVASAGISGPVVAEQSQGDGGQSAAQSGQQLPVQKLQKQRQAIQQLSQKLFKIQQATLEANPELKQQRDDLMSLVDTKMKEAGHEPQAKRDKIKGLQQQLQGGDLSQEKAQSLNEELRKAKGSLRKAQQQAMQDQEVQQQRQALSQSLVSAMKEQNPKAEQLLADLQQARKQYRSILQNAMQKQQQQQQ